MKNSKNVWLLGVALLVSCISLSPRPDHPHQTLRKTTRAFVKLTFQKGPKFTTGSGAILKQHDGTTYVLTVNHLCSFVQRGYRAKVQIMSGERYRIYAYRGHPDEDLCIMSTPHIPHLQPTLDMADKPPIVGEKVWNISAPFGMVGSESALIFDGRFSGHGQNIQGVPKQEGVDRWDIYTLPAAQGASGAPVLNQNGDIVGVISMGPPQFKQVVLSPRFQIIREFWQSTSML